MLSPDSNNLNPVSDSPNSGIYLNSPPSTQNYTDLQVVRKLNKSKFPVFLVRSKNDDKHYAMKIYPFQQGKVSEYFLKEAQFSWLSHPNIIPILDTQATKKGYGNKKPLSVSYTLMEYARHGDFADLIANKKLPRNDKLVRTYFAQLVSGLQYLHQNGVAHLDLKLDNLLLGQDYQLKISDFDFSILVKKDFLTDHAGVINYRAPELKKRRCTNFKAADIYSAGVILFLLKTGLLPYAEEGSPRGQALYKFLLEGKEKEFWEYQEAREGMPQLDDSFKELFMAMVNPDVRKRITVDEIFCHEWMRGPQYSNEELHMIMQQKLEGHIPSINDKSLKF